MPAQKQKNPSKAKGIQKVLRELPSIPDKLYFTIGEVSQLCDLKTHVLRYWEQEFPQLAPSKRRGNRRYYQRKDVFVVRKIKNLLYDQGFTIEGARSQLTNEEDKTQTNTHVNHHSLQTIIADLENVLFELERSSKDHQEVTSIINPDEMLILDPVES